MILPTIDVSKFASNLTDNITIDTVRSYLLAHAKQLHEKEENKNDPACIFVDTATNDVVFNFEILRMTPHL